MSRATTAMPPLEHGTALDVRVLPATRWAEVAPTWEELARPASFFYGVPWMEAWLGTFAALLRPNLLLFDAGGATVGACLLVVRREARGPVPVTRVYLNTSSEDRVERSSTEYNTLLCRPGWERAVARALGAYLRGQSWDEVVANGFCPGPVLEALRADAFSATTELSESRPSYYVDLAELRAAGRDYDAALSRNKRWQMRRYARAYEDAEGALRLEIGATAETALAMFDELVALHQRAWQARGMPGAFASPRKVAFHRALIAGHAGTGAVQLLRLSAGAHTVGVLYNLIADGKVYFYQSGFAYRERFHPGYVTLTAAIRHYLAQGLDEFDFLAGDQQYKKSLSTHERPLTWLVFRRRNAKNRALDVMVAARRRLAALRNGTSRAEEQP